MDAQPGLSLGTLLTAMRVQSGLTQVELARRAGVSRRAIGDLERGVTHVPQQATLELLADALALGPDDRERIRLAARAADARLGGPRRPAPSLPNRAGVERARALLGRDADAAALRRLLAPGALVTATGAGGVGKSRLALEAVRAEAAAGRAVHVVALETLDSADGVVAAIAAALDAPPGATAAGLGGLLAPGAVLLLDDADHVRAAAPQIATLAASAPGAAVLVTSREPLGVAGERVFPVPPLAAPEAAAIDDPATLAENAAVALFLERAAEAGRPLPDAQLADAARIVAALDGMPLAIELAAAQLHALEPAAILALLDSAGPRLLVRSGADTGDRQRAMTAAIAWSADLLPPPAQELLTVLGAFRGGVSAEALAAVLADAGEPGLAAALPDLVRASLVFAADAPGRWSMLEPVRYVAWERLEASPRAQAIRLAHARWHARWAARIGDEVFGPRMEAALAAEAADRANAVAAARWALANGEAELAAAIEDGLWRIWDMAGQAALWRTLVEPIAARAADIRDPLARSMARFRLATCVIKYGEPATIRRHVAAIALSEPDDRTAWALGTLARSISRLDAGDPGLLRDLREARGILAATGHPQALTVPALELAGALAWGGEIGEALALLRETAARLEREGDRFELPLALQVLGQVQLDTGDPAAARDSLARAAALHRPGHPPARLAMTVALLALALGEGAAEPGARRHGLVLAGAAEAWFARVGLPLPELLPARFAAMTAAIAGDLGPAETEALLAEGRALPLEEANALALGWLGGG